MHPDIEQIARECHEAIRVYGTSIGETHQLPWDQAPDPQKKSMVAGVRLVLDQPDIKPGVLHTQWCEYKARRGWTWGPELNTVLQTHPQLVPFEKLPDEQKRKDEIFLETVKACLSKVLDA